MAHTAYSTCKVQGPPWLEKRGKWNFSYSREWFSPSPSHSPTPLTEVRLCHGYSFGGFPPLFHTVGPYGSGWDPYDQISVEGVDALTACLAYFLEALGEPHDSPSHIRYLSSHQLQIVALLRSPPVQQEMDPKHFSFLHTTNHWTTGNTCGSLPS